MMHCTDPQFQSALHTSGHYLFHPRMMGALQMAGGFAEASIGTGLIGTPFAPLGAFLMLHGADHMATGFRSLTSGQHARTLTTSGLMQMGLSESSASMIDAGIGVVGSAGGVRLGLRATQGALQLGGYTNIKYPQQLSLRSSNLRATQKIIRCSNLQIDRRFSFAGSKRFQLDYAPYQKIRNSATTIGTRHYSGHALDRMQDRGYFPCLVENAIKQGKPLAGKNQIVNYYDHVNKMNVIVNQKGQVVTIVPGRKK